MHVPGCFVFRSLTYLSLQICGSRFLKCCLLFDKFPVHVGHCVCECTDTCLSACVYAQLKWGWWGCWLADALSCSILRQQFHSQIIPCKALSADIINYSQMDSWSGGRMQFRLNWKAQFGQPDSSLLTTQLKEIKNWNYPKVPSTGCMLHGTERKTSEGKFRRSLQARLLSVVFYTKCHISLSLEFSLDLICADCSLLIYIN